LLQVYFDGTFILKLDICTSQFKYLNFGSIVLVLEALKPTFPKWYQKKKPSILKGTRDFSTC
jgi:hypothetical protein